MEKIAFVVHEFGMFKGRGGIASYIYYLCKSILKYNKQQYEIHVLTPMYDERCELLEERHFKLHEITEKTVAEQGKMVSRILKKIQPCWVETSDYEGLCLEAMLARNAGCGQLQDTKFYVIHHTASRECYEWSYSLPFKLASGQLKHVHYRETASYYLCDQNIFPSYFLADYIKKMYGIKHYEMLRYTYDEPKRNSRDYKKEAGRHFHLDGLEGKFVISYISRIEGRKNQKYLIDSYIRFLNQTDTDAVLIIAGNSLTNEIYHYDEMENLYLQIPPQYREHIWFYDFLQKEMYDLICSVSNVAVMASVFENFPIAMMEYVYMGIPVMASKYSGCKDYMGGYVELTAFDPFSEEDLADKLLRFSKLSGPEQKKAADIQYQKLHELCSPKNSLAKKFSCYGKQHRIETVHNNKAKMENCCFVQSSQLAASIPKDWEAGRDSLCVTGQFSAKACREFLENNSALLENLPKDSVLMWGEYEMCTGMWDALNTGAAVYIPDFRFYEQAYRNIAQLAADNIWKRLERFVYLPFGKREQETEKYVLITNWLFKRINEISLEELYREK